MKYEEIWEGFCSRSMLQGHAPGANFLCVYQRFHGYTNFILGSRISTLQNVPQYLTSCGNKLRGQIEPPRVYKMSLEHAPGTKPLVCVGLKRPLNYVHATAMYKSGTGTRGQGHPDACVRTWVLGM